MREPSFSTKSSFGLWWKIIWRWPARFLSTVLLLILSIPFAFGLLILVPYSMQILQKDTVHTLLWEDLFGKTLWHFLEPLFLALQSPVGLSAMDQRWLFPLALILCGLGYGILSFVGDYSLRHLGEKLARYLRSQIINTYFSFAFQKASHVDPGYIASLVGENIREVQQTFTRILNTFFKDGLTVVIFILWLAVLDIQLFFLFIGVLLPTAVVLRLTSKTLKRLSRQGLTFESHLLTSLLEKMNGWQTIQTHKAVDYELEKFNQTNTSIYHVWRRAARAKALSTPLVEWFGIVAGACLVVVALRRIASHDLEAHVLVSFFVTVGFLADKMNRIVSQLNSTRKGTDALHRIVSFTRQKNTNVPPWKMPSVPAALPTNAELVFENVSVPVGQTPQNALEEDDEPNLLRWTFPLQGRLGAGDWGVVVGPSGVGKSTLIRHVLGLATEHKGRILLNQQEPTLCPLTLYQSHFGFIAQDPFILKASILENVLYPQPLDVATKGSLTNSTPTVDAETLARVKKSLDLACLNLDPQTFAQNLSGGEKQRLAFARVFYHKPTFIVIDEATSALDLKNEKELLENLKQALPKSVVLVIAHREALRQQATVLFELKSSEV
jgi:ABC-type multidrug transport system fused ATPase/permease subunit